MDRVETIPDGKAAEKRDCRILCVEDDPSIQRAVNALVKRSGAKVTCASTAADGLDKFRAEAPDLVLMDVGLPDGSGFDVCRRMRREGGENLPILMLTGYQDIKSRLRGFKLGASDYITKPFSGEELVARIKVHLAQKETVEGLSREKSEAQLRNQQVRENTEMIVHDLKAPLAAIQSTLLMVNQDKPVSHETLHKFIKNSELTANFMLLMINDILDLNRSESGGLKPLLESIPAAGPIKRVADMFENRFARLKLRLETNVLPKDLLLITDENLLFRILVNLVSNAMKMSRVGGTVKLSCVRDGGWALWMVSDRGPGVPDEKKEEIFKKYVQVDRTLEPLGRSGGIGLAFCRVAAEAMDGRIWVEDRDGGGSRFVVSLPAEGCHGHA